jgi:hypothetical protein
MYARHVSGLMPILFLFSVWLILCRWNQPAPARDISTMARVEDSERIQRQNNFEDIAWRTSLGLHYLDNNPDPALAWMPYSGALITGLVSHYSHGPWDACDSGWRMVEAYILARQLLGQRTPGDAESKLRAFVLHTIRDDGLSYRPDKPWCKPDASMWDHGRAVIALATWLKHEPSEDIKKCAHDMAEGLARIAVHEDDYWHFPTDSWTGTQWVDRDLQAFPPTGLAIEGLVDLADVLKDKRYLEIAGHFVQAVRKWKPPIFNDDGSMVKMGGGPYKFAFTHVHARLGILIGLLKYALATHDEPLRQWCVRAYLYVKEKMSSSHGWVPESMESGTDAGVSILSTRRRDEGCSISDMIQLASILAHNGMPKERLTILRYGTNQIFAHQLPEHTPIKHLVVRGKNMTDTPEKSYRDMPERALGSLTAGTYPNDLCVDLRSFGAPQYSIDAAGCCSPAGIKALYVLWHEAVESVSGELHVHLWATLQNGYLEMHCDEPRTGKLTIVMKQPSEALLIHLPDYVSAQHLTANRGVMGADGILRVAKVKKGDVVSLSYSIDKRSTVETIAGKEYQIDWRGGRVVEIHPSAIGCDPYSWRSMAR